MDTGQPDKAISPAQEALRLDGKDFYAYGHIAIAYLHLNRYDEAKTIVDQAIAQKADSWPIHLVTYQLAFIRGDENGMGQNLAQAVGKPYEPTFLGYQSDGLCEEGKIKQAREAYARTFSAAQASGYKEYTAGTLEIEAQCDLEAGFVSEARQKVEAGLALSADPWSRAFAAYLFARLNDSTRAQKLADDLAKEFPSDTLMNRYKLPLIRAALSLQRNQPDQAIAQTDAAIPYELASPRVVLSYVVIATRGEAFLRAHNGEKAAAEYQKILDHQGLNATNVLYPLAHLGLARAHVLLGDTAKAKTAYQDFFATWKDADPDIPILKTAKAEYEKLK
jgi:eukaryotic-like serine/threonine-protein kinase